MIFVIYFAWFTQFKGLNAWVKGMWKIKIFVDIDCTLKLQEMSVTPSIGGMEEAWRWEGANGHKRKKGNMEYC